MIFYYSFAKYENFVNDPNWIVLKKTIPLKYFQVVGVMQLVALMGI